MGLVDFLYYDKYKDWLYRYSEHRYNSTHILTLDAKNEPTKDYFTNSNCKRFLDEPM